MAIVFVGRVASLTCSGLVKTAYSVGGIFFGHRRDDTEPRMEGWIEIVHIVA